MKSLVQMQCKAALWITGAFRTSPLGGVEALAGLIPIHLHLKKLSQRGSFRVATLSSTHLIRLLLDVTLHMQAIPHQLSFSCLAPKKCEEVQGATCDALESIQSLGEAFDATAEEAHLGN